MLEECNLNYSLDVVCGDGVEVIDYLFATGDHTARDPQGMPRLLLLDLKMPRMNGLQVLQVLRRVRLSEWTKLPPVVALTSSNEEHDINEVYRWGLTAISASRSVSDSSARQCARLRTIGWS